jgi:hypothetical protein
MIQLLSYAMFEDHFCFYHTLRRNLLTYRKMPVPAWCRLVNNGGVRMIGDIKGGLVRKRLERQNS